MIPQRSRARRGAAAMELGLWIPIIMIVFTGITDLSFYISQKHALVRATRDGARVAAAQTGLTGSDIEFQLEAAGWCHANRVLSQGAIDCAAASGCFVSANWLNNASTGFYDVIDLQITYAYTPFFGVLPFLEGDQTSRFQMLTQSACTSTDDGTCDPNSLLGLAFGSDPNDCLSY